MDFTQLDYKYILSIAVPAIIVLWIYHKQNKKKKLIYSFNDASVINSNVSIEKLKIRYEGKILNAFSVTKLMIANTGDITIEQGDIAPKNKLRVEVTEGHKILDPTIVENNLSKDVRLVPLEDNSLEINFDYINANDGMVIKFFHDGAREVTVLGNIKGVGEPKYSKKIKSKSSHGMLFIVGLIVYIISPSLNDLLKALIFGGDIIAASKTFIITAIVAFFFLTIMLLIVGGVGIVINRVFLRKNKRLEELEKILNN